MHVHSNSMRSGIHFDEVLERCQSVPTRNKCDEREGEVRIRAQSARHSGARNAGYFQARGVSCMEEELFDEAHNNFSSALATAADSEKSFLLRSRSKSSLKLGNITGAIHDAFRCVQEYPDCVGGYVQLCEACLMIGDRERARSFAIQGKTLDSTNSEVNRLLLRSSETKQSNSIPMLFLQQCVCSHEEDRANVLQNWDTKIKDEMYETILEDWNAIIFFLLSSSAETVLSQTRFALLKEVLNLEPNSSYELVADICQAFFCFGEAINRTLLLQLAIAGWRQIIPCWDKRHGANVAGYNLCLGFAHLQVQSGSRAANIEKAIASFQKALDTLDFEAFADPWAAAHQGLAEAFKNRLKGAKDKNSLQAIQHFKHLTQVHTVQNLPLRYAFIHYEIAQLYASIANMKQSLHHVDISTLGLNATRSAEERHLKATLHRFAADVLVNAAKNRFEVQMVERSEEHVSEYLSGAISHFQAVLEVWRSNLTTFEKGGIVCFFAHEDRHNLVKAHQKFSEALAGAEACAMVFHGYDKGFTKASVWARIQSLLFACFSGCIEAMAYSERSRVHDVLGVSLASVSRPWLLQAMQPEDVAEFLKLRSRLDQYAQCLQHNAKIERDGEINFSPDPRLRGMLRDAAKLIMLISNQGAHTGGRKMRLIQLKLPPIMDMGPSIWKQATARERDEVIVEWYIGTERAYVFIISDRDPSPKTIEYTNEQMRNIVETTNAFYAVITSLGPFDPNDADRILSALTAVSDALRMDAILAAIPAHCNRLIIVPHGVLYSLPFTALPYGSAGARSCSSGHLQYLIDRFTLGVVCVPSIAMLQWCEDRASQMRFAPILQGLALNKYSSKKNMDGKESARTDAEFACLRKTLSKLTVEHQLTMNRLQEREDLRKGTNQVTMANADIVHCACRSFCNIDNGFKGGIEAGDEEELDTSQIAAKLMSNCRLVSLAANRQELVHKKRTDSSTNSHDAEGKVGSENFGYKGLPLGFLIAGSSSVLETLWCVDHDCRVIFWARFYDMLITEGRDIAETLRLTQIWLREASMLDLIKCYPKEMNSLGIQQQTEELEALVSESQQVHRSPFHSPYYWGGVVFWGDGTVSGHRKTEKKETYDYNAAVTRYAEAQAQQEATKGAQA